MMGDKGQVSRRGQGYNRGMRGAIDAWLDVLGMVVPALLMAGLIVAVCILAPAWFAIPFTILFCLAAVTWAAWERPIR